MPLTKIEILSALLRVLDARDEMDRQAAEARQARTVTPDSVCGAVASGEDTWARLHAYFPESEWPALGPMLDRLQREERMHRPESLRFVLGARPVPWRA